MAPRAAFRVLLPALFKAVLKTAIQGLERAGSQAPSPALHLAGPMAVIPTHRSDAFAAALPAALRPAVRAAQGRRLGVGYQ